MSDLLGISAPTDLAYWPAASAAPDEAVALEQQTILVERCLKEADAAEQDHQTAQVRAGNALLKLQRLFNAGRTKARWNTAKGQGFYAWAAERFGKTRKSLMTYTYIARHPEKERQKNLVQRPSREKADRAFGRLARQSNNKQVRLSTLKRVFTNLALDERREFLKWANSTLDQSRANAGDSATASGGSAAAGTDPASRLAGGRTPAPAQAPSLGGAVLAEAGAPKSPGTLGVRPSAARVPDKSEDNGTLQSNSSIGTAAQGLGERTTSRVESLAAGRSGVDGTPADRTPEKVQAGVRLTSPEPSSEGGHIPGRAGSLAPGAFQDDPRAKRDTGSPGRALS